MSKKPVIYIAGPECFYPNAMELAKEAIQLCEKYGFEGLSPIMGHPSLPAVDFSNGKKEAAKQIFYKNINLINMCDIVVANLNNFRGWEPDGGTCFEIGYAYTQSKKIYGFMEDTRPCYEKYIGNVHYDAPFWRDDNGAFFESGACNLMISGHAPIIQGGLEDALKKVKADLESQEEK